MGACRLPGGEPARLAENLLFPRRGLQHPGDAAGISDTMHRNEARQTQCANHEAGDEVRNLVVRTPAPGVAARAPAGRAGRLVGAILAGLAVLAGVAWVGFTSSAAAQPAAAAAASAPAAAELPELRIVEYGAGKKVFDRLVEHLYPAAGPGVRPVLTDATSIAAFQAFCQPVAGRGPDILLTTRRIFPDVASACSSNDAQRMAEVELGRGAMVLAVRRGSELTQLTRQQVYLALARDVPYRGEFHRNTSIQWSDIDRSLPEQDIRFQLPPREVGGRVMFDSLVLEAGCRQEPMIKLIFSAQHRTARCVTTRVDRVRDVARVHAVEELLAAPVGTVGVLGYSDVVQSGGALVALALDGVVPTAETIVQDTYDVSGSFWLYARRGQPDTPAAVDTAVTNIIGVADGEPIIGPDGLLAKLGVLPLPEDERAAQRAALDAEAGFYRMGSVLGWISSAAGGAWNLAGISFGELNPPTTAQSIDLNKLMDIAGYKIKEFQTTFGLIPGADMSFGQAREMSAGDLEYLERTLYRDERRRPGLLSAIQRRIVRTIIYVSSSEGYQVDHVDISLFPLPSVTLVVAPAQPIVGPQTTLLMQAIERLQDRVNEIEH
jgi:phosphate transport system substrate-binding protein